MYKLGTVFQMVSDGAFHGSKYILSTPEEYHVLLVNVEGGTRWSNKVKVENVMQITEDEFYKLCRGSIFKEAPLFPELPVPKICPCKPKEIPEIIPGIKIGFKHVDNTTLCYMYVQRKLRVGVAVLSNKDKDDSIAGEKVALARVLKQQKTGQLVRKVIWAQYLFTQGVVKDPDPIITFFKSGKVTTNLKR